MKLIINFSLFFILLSPHYALAELPEQVKADFAPLNGVIIMPVEDQYLIDLDATSDLKEGDILTLTVPGEKVIHPVTKEILGTLDSATGFLQVTQIKTGYSYARLISAKTPPQKGAEFKRFEQVPAVFTSAEETTLAAELKNGLPHLNWSENDKNTDPQLIFSLNGAYLQVKNSEGVTLRSYQYDTGQLAAPAETKIIYDNFAVTSQAQQNKSVLNQAVDNLLGSVGFGGEDKRLENPGIIRSTQQQSNAIWMGPNLDGNPAGIAVADFNHDGIQEIAVAMEDQIQILQVVDGDLSVIEKIEFSGGTHLLSLDSFDLDNDSLPELYVSANNGINIRSRVIEFKEGHFEVTMESIPWLFRVVDLGKQGETLIGQMVDTGENPFTSPAFKIVRQGNDLEKAEPVATPKNSFFSFTQFSTKEDEGLYAFISAGDYLKVGDGQLSGLWESNDYFGGSEEFFYNRKDRQAEVRQPVYIQKRIVKLPSDEILVAQNDGPRTLQRYRNFKKSRVVAFRWDGFSLNESWRTSEQGGYLADFAIADADNDGQDELVMVVKYSQKSLVNKGRSTVVIYELGQ